ncbi:MAG: GC-type dockerin domain-anchored protein [Planctomycetota bacterium]
MTNTAAKATLTRTLSAALTLSIAGAASGQSFSLDDNPSAPLTSAPFAGLSSAEDPFGLFLPAVAAGRIGPSPSLITPLVAYTDGDILTFTSGPFPVLDVVPPAGTYLNAMSADHERFDAEVSQEMNIRFSVDRATTGLPGTDLEKQFALNQQPGDIYASESLFPNPGVFVGSLGGPGFAGLLPTAAPGVPGFHFLEIDEIDLGLVAGVPTPASDPAPPIAPGEHDNVDAYNVLPDPTLDVDGDAITDHDYFFSVPPASAAVAGVSAADIFAVPTGAPGGPGFPWASAGSMGLDSTGFPPNTQIELFDDVDGLVVWDFGRVAGPNGDDGMRRAEPGRDYALFSLSETSASLAAIRSTGLPVDGSTIFFTDFTGAFAVYIFGGQVGVADILTADRQFANIDALEICAMVDDPCDPCVLADVNGDGIVTPADFTAWVLAFNASDPAADQNCDGIVTPADFTAWILNFNLCS